jgi:hypothetical protein
VVLLPRGLAAAQLDHTVTPSARAAVASRWLRWAFVVSLAGMAISSIYTLGMSSGAEIMGTGGLIFSAVIWLVATGSISTYLG